MKTSAREILRRARQLKKEGEEIQAWALVADAISRAHISHADIGKAGRFLDGLSDKGIADGTPSLNLLLAGQCTLTSLKDALIGWAAARGVRLRVEDCGYDTILQDLARRADEGACYDIVFTHAWNQRLLNAGSTEIDTRIGEEVDFWRDVWDLATTRLGARLVHVGVDWVNFDSAGDKPLASDPATEKLVAETNRRKRMVLPAGSFYINPTAVSAGTKENDFYDQRGYLWTKNPYSEWGAYQMARHLWSGIQALTTGPKKVLVLDLDNTLWGGVVGELGAHGLTMGEGPEGSSYKAFQTYCKGLSDRGILLAVASKNNLDDARAPFEECEDCALALDDFAAFEAHWKPKHISLERIAKSLKLGLDSFVFFDDSPVERENIRQLLPEVEVVNVPDNPCDFIAALQGGLYFEAIEITYEDRARRQNYRQEAQRAGARTNAASLDTYFASLEMKGRVEPIGKPGIPRAAQLIAKTNQFNFTTRRHGHDDIRRFGNDDRGLVMGLSLKDKFGDYGMVGVIIAHPTENSLCLHIDTFLMSCRVLERTVENFFVAELLSAAQALGYTRVTAEYVPTAKNSWIAHKYDQLGFDLGETREDGSKHYQTVLPHRGPASFVKPLGPK